MKPMIFGLGAALLAVTSCQHVAETQPSAGQLWFESLADLCGQGAFAGQLVSDDAVDADFKTSALIAGPATCTEGEVRIPFAVDEDRSRTWVITETEAGLRFKHDHRHKDGTKDVLTWYGGDVLGEGTVNRQEFPVDAETRALFTQQDIEVSNQNTWAMDIVPGETLTYQMWRPNRNFQVEFDLTTEIPAPPLPWGVEPIE
jgi:hypothetical protein